MASNAGYLDDGKYTTMSSLSVVASRATVLTQDAVVTSALSVGGTQTAQGGIVANGGVQVGTGTQVITTDGTAVNPPYAFTSERSLGFYRSAASIVGLSYGELQLGDGSSILPSFGFRSEVSLGAFRSAASTMKLSYGTLDTSAASLLFGNLASSITTAQSGATAKLGQGQLYFSVLSLTTNGGEFGFRSGNTVYRFQSTAVG